MSDKIRRIIDAIVLATGKAEHDWPEAVSDSVHLRIAKMLTAPAWSKPKDAEAEIDAILRDVRGLRRRVQGLHHHTAALARQAKDAREREDALNRVAVAADESDLVAHARAVDELKRIMFQPKEQWVDFAALHHLDALERCLTVAAGDVIEAAPSGRGRPANRHANRAALEAARIYIGITGEMPTFWNGGSTPFSRLVDEVFAVAGISVQLRQPIEAAMRKLRAEV